MQTSRGVRKYVKSQKERKYWLYAMIILSLVVAVTVFSSLIMPGITISGGTEIGGKTPIVLGSDKVNDKNYIFAPEFTPNAGQEDNLDSKTGTFTIKFNLGAGELSTEKNIITYQLPESVLATIEVDPSYFSEPHNMYDESGALAGTFIISETGLVTITCTETYINSKKDDLDSGGATGNFSFNATVKRDKDTAGDVDLNFGTSGETPDVNVSFAGRTLDVEKEGALSEDKKTAKWTITVRNPDEHDLGGYKISDDMFSAAGDSFSSAYGSLNEDKDFIFNDGVTNSKIEITYETPIDMDQIINSSSWGNITNSVKVTLDDPIDDEVNDTANVSVSGFFSIEKSGTPDYSDLTSPSIDWTVKVKNDNGLNIKGMVIQDDAFKYLTKSDITVSEGVEYDLDTLTGTIKITNDYVGTTLDITYNSSKNKDGNPISLGEYVENKATIKKDDGNDFTSTNPSVTYSPFSFYKDGSVNPSAGTITWKVKIENSGKLDLSGFKVVDEMVKDATDGNVKLTIGWSVGNTIVAFGSDGSYTIPSDLLSAWEGTTWNDVAYIEFEYTVPAEDYKATDGSITATNTAKLYEPSGTEVSESTKTVEYNPNSKLDKYLVNSTKIDGNDDKLLVEYKYYLVQDLGLTAQTLTDEISASNNNVLHYISKEQAESMTLKYKKKSDSGQYVLESELYEIKFYDKDGTEIDFSTDADAKAVKFTVELKEGIESKDPYYTELEVVYKAIVDATSTDVPYDTKITLSNEVTTNEPEVAQTNNKTTKEYSKKNPDNTPYKKVDSINKQENSDIYNSALKTVEIDGTEYYVMGWYVELNSNGYYNDVSGPLTFVDTLPEGFEQYGAIKCYSNATIENATSGSYYSSDLSTDFGNWGNKFKTETTDGVSKITFVFDGGLNCVTTLYYEAKIPVADFDTKLTSAGGSLTLTNTFADSSEKYAPVNQTENITQGQLNKESVGDMANRYKKYRVEVNPTGGYLNGGEPIQITDVFYTQSCSKDGTQYYCYDKGAVNVDLINFVVYEIQDDGSEVVVDPSKYNYIFDNNPEDKNKTYTYNTFTKTDTASNSLFVSEETDVKFINGTTITVKFTGVTSTSEWGGQSFNYYFNNDKYGNPSGWIDTYTTDADGNYIFTIDFDKDFSGGQLYLETTNFTAENVEVTFDHVEHDYAAKIDMSVPDGKKLIVEYTFYCEPNGYSNNYVGVVNTVESKINSKTETSVVGDTLNMVGESSGTITTNKGLTIKKVDVADFSTKLEAEFEIYKYDETSSTWLPATAFTKYVDDASTSSVDVYTATWGAVGDTAATFKTTTGSYNIRLDTTKLYKLIEVNAPTGFIKNDDPIYFTYGTYSGGLPSDVTADNVKAVMESGTFNVTNKRNTSITVKKSWDDDTHSSDSVNVKLYRSTQKVTNGFPEIMEEVNTGEVITLNNSNSWTHTWANLPTGDDEGTAYYYYVKEISYTVGDTTYNTGEGDYSTYYTNNGVNYTTSPIEILNSIGLQVKKEWVDKNGISMDVDITSINFQLYRSTISSSSIPAGAEQVSIDELTDFTLTASNDWTKLFTGLPREDDEGNLYYYYVKEITTDESFTVSYIGNGKPATGVITIQNKSDTAIDTGVELPHTGGNGTTFYYVIGFAIIVTAAISILINKKQIIKE